MIRFRCWFCNKAYLVADARAGVVLPCTCGRQLRVPKVSDRNSRYRSPLDWLIEWTVYGGAGALLGFLLALLILSKVPFAGRAGGRWLLLGLPLAGLLIGGVGGEAGINWVGRIIRGWEQR